MSLISNMTFILACALCKSTVENAADSQELSQGINLGVLFMFVPTVLIFSLIFFAAYRSDKETRNDEN